MTYKKTVPTTYAIFFPESRLLKVGVSAGQRWRNWVARGAAVVQVHEFEFGHEARVFERRTITFLQTRVLHAFTCEAEAFEATGIRAGGWSEFFRIPEGVDPLALLSEMAITA